MVSVGAYVCIREKRSTDARSAKTPGTAAEVMVPGFST